MARSPFPRRFLQLAAKLGAAALVLLLLGAWAIDRARPIAAAAPPTADAESYDYWLLALSWSPSYCLAHPDDREQCGQRGYGLVLHGLWPQYEAGGGPLNCAIRAEPNAATVRHALAFMPSRRLIEHQWRRHGSCSGLSPAAYFELADRAHASLRVPPKLEAPARELRLRAGELRAAFMRSNPGLADDMFSLQCRRGVLQEVRVCLARDGLAPRRCGRQVRDRCPAASPLRLPAAR